MRKKEYYDTFGGVKVFNTISKVSRMLALMGALVLLSSISAFAQGSIFGTVTNSDASIPANGEISFFGYLDDTDEEIRIETCVGAGYDAGNWFDDFQNYLTEAPGNPYDYHFYNIANGEGAVLSKLIPNNSFQQEDIDLAPVAWPLKPTGLGATVVSSSSIVISWNYIPGETYHVYRRLATSNGSFFRIDNPGGSLADPGVAVGYFVDNTSDGTSGYHYLVIAENAGGSLGPHSDVLVVDGSVIAAPAVISIDPDSGSYIGGTPVTIAGSGFDMNGATATIGGNPLTSLSVVSPFEMTGLTPAGTIGAADVSVTNTASGLSANPLIGGYDYLANSPPVLNAIGPRSINEGENLNFTVTATDPDGTTPNLFAEPLPGTATFVDNGGGSGTFDWTTTFADAGIYTVTFYATDNIDTVFEDVEITVNEVGNQAPVLDSIGPRTVTEGNNLNFLVTASDPDGTTPELSATGLPLNATFDDNLDGTGTFDFNPDLTQEGLYSVTFKAFDGILVDSEVVEITVLRTNQTPVLDSIGEKDVFEGINLNFTVIASDGDNDSLILFTSALPGTAAFTDNGDGSGIFDWTPSFTDAGTYDVTFYATDEIDTVSELVTITVQEVGNQPPVLDSIGPLAVIEGDTLIQLITASDPDGTIPSIGIDSLPANAVFVDSGNGIATFTFTPDFAQSGSYNVLFYTSDGVLSDSELVTVTVNESGNQTPVLSVVSDTSIYEGDSLVVVVDGYDPDGGAVSLNVFATVMEYGFVDSGNGVGVFRFEADYYDAGSETVSFIVSDNDVPVAADTVPMSLNIIDVNQAPEIAPIGPFGVAVGDTLTFDVTASDSTDPNPSYVLILSALGAPVHSSFVDNGNNTGTFTFIPDSTQVGTINVTFTATDNGSPALSDNLPVDINIVQENRPPVIDVEDAYTVFEGGSLSFTVTATDPDGNTIVLSISELPDNATFTDNGGGVGSFAFDPDYTQSGLYGLVFRAYDGFAVTKKNVLVQVYEAGNQAPEVDSLPTQTVTEGDSIQITITASDPDGDTPVLTADSLPENATFIDNGDGTGLIDFNPTFTQSGTYDVYIYADDGEYVDTLIVTIEVAEAGNQPPSISDPGQQQANENQTVNFTLTSSDPDMTRPALSAANMPEGATFVDNGDYTGTFNWVTDYFDGGDHIVTFYATDSLDAGLYDSVNVFIRVDNVNQAVIIYVTGFSPYEVDEGDTLNIYVYGVDPDSSIPILEVNTPGYTLDSNMTFYDSLNGVGLFTFAPDYSQGNDPQAPTQNYRDYYIQFRAIDADDPSVINPSNVLRIKVYDKNQAPVIAAVNDTTTTEGDTLSISISATDPDGTIPTLNVDPTTLPENSSFTGPFTNMKTFNFMPEYTQAGPYTITFIASDGSLADTLNLNVEVLEAGNQAPYFTSILPDTQIVLAGQSFSSHITAADADADILTITVDTVLPYAAFIDSGNGAASYNYFPTLSQVGEINLVTFFVEDPSGGTDTMATYYRVVDFLRGDANSDMELNMLDIMFLINFLYKGGQEPASLESADVNFDSLINLLDPTYLINFFYKQGPPPPGL